LFFLLSIIGWGETFFSWEKPHCKIVKGDILWEPENFVFKCGESPRYIDYENGDDYNDGKTKNTPWKHHPWDLEAEGNAKKCKGIHTYIFKRGVIYRGTLICKESGEANNPIILTSDPSWGNGEACIYGSIRITEGWKRCTEKDIENVPDFRKIWYIDIGTQFTPRAIWLIDKGKIKRIHIAREPDWEEKTLDDVHSQWWEWTSIRIEKERGKWIYGTDKVHLTNPDPDYFKGATVWTEGSSVIGTPSFKTLFGDI